ncbi:MAG: hypothetical protein J1F29_00750 [Lentimicrobiaceae bacterium]|nr:hypothetical protein [Lentimicrobiaceae bacterium]
MTDIKHTDNGDIDFITGDLRYVNSDYRHQQDILLSQKGYYKEHPELGVGIGDYRNETDPEELLRAIKKEFVADGMKVNKVILSVDGQIETDARYENN